MKLGANIASTCHWMPSAAMSADRPQPTMASGVAVITRLIEAKETAPQPAETTKRGWAMMAESGRAPAPGAGGAGLGISMRLINISAMNASTAEAEKVPRNRKGGKRSLVQITTWGPMTAEAMPPTSTQEIALATNRSLARSAAANR